MKSTVGQKSAVEEAFQLGIKHYLVNHLTMMNWSGFLEIRYDRLNQNKGVTTEKNYF